MALIKRDIPTREADERTHCRDRDGLIAQLNAPGDFERREAARDLPEHPDVSDALCRRLEIELEPTVRAVLLSSLTQVGDERAVFGLISLLSSEDAELRNGAISALKCLPDQIGGRIEALLRDDDPDVRIFAVNILESLPHPNVPDWLCHVIEEDQNVNVCGAAIDLLADLGTPEMIPAMFALLKRFADEPFMVFAVELTINRINSASVIEIPA